MIVIDKQCYDRVKQKLQRKKKKAETVTWPASKTFWLSGSNDIQAKFWKMKAFLARQGRGEKEKVLGKEKCKPQHKGEKTVC